VAKLLGSLYRVIHPFEIMEEVFDVKGSLVRHRMANGGAWQELVPGPVVDYIKQNDLGKRLERYSGHYKEAEFKPEKLFKQRRNTTGK